MLQMTIGPSRIAPSVLECMSVPPPAINDPDFLQVLGQCLRDLRTILGSKDGQTFIIPGTGTMGMEMLAANVVPAGSSVLIVSTGYWGDRWAVICQRLGLNVSQITCAPGTHPDVDRVEAELSKGSCRALFVTHVDSSSGVLTDIKLLSEIAQRYGVITLVDGICAAGIEVIEQTAWGVDVYVTGTPKGLGVPAGLALISANERTTDLLKHRGWECRSLALDLRPWVPVMEAAERGEPEYFQSPAGNLVLGLAEGLRLVLAEGLAAREKRHQELSRTLHDGLEAMGIRLLVENPAWRANGASVCVYPDSLATTFINSVKSFGVLLVPGLHPELAAQTFRIGHLGNVTRKDIDTTLHSISQALSAGSVECFQAPHRTQLSSGQSSPLDAGTPSSLS
jgi:alanine-glyoxylate transaminase/serine-glyoxylate transaminase/serine-pyruvate transaminase